MNIVTIVDYDTHWPEQFEFLRSRIAPTLGKLAAAIEHVGSTSVPGLAAKPIIDFDILLRSANDLPEAIAALALLGYSHRGDLGIVGREAFARPAGDIHHHLYVCRPDSHPYREHIAFRDYLRSHPEDGAAYAHLKRKLAAQFGADREGYNNAKKGFVETILRRAGEI